MNYNWDDARVFLAVARAGKIAAAGEALNLTTITISRRLAAFEARLNTVLFARHRLGVDLTDAGQKYFEIFERAEREMMSASALADAADIEFGLVRLAATDGLATHFAMHYLPQFAENYPGIEIEIVPLSRNFNLSRREADLAVTVGKPSGERLFSRKLSDYSLKIYGSKDYLKRNGTPQSAQDLADHRLIGFVDDLLISDDLNYSQEAWRGWHNTISIHSSIGQIAAVQAGAGLAVLHDYLVREDQDLVQVLPEIEIIREYWLVTHENIRTLPKIRALWDNLMAMSLR